MEGWPLLPSAKGEIPATEWRVFPDFWGKDATEWRNY